MKIVQEGIRTYGKCDLSNGQENLCVINECCSTTDNTSSTSNNSVSLNYNI